MSEVRALLLTDVVDSTALSQTLGDSAMAKVWEAHDRVARDLLPHWRGREVDKTDGMLLLFDDVADAVPYAFAYHRALAALPVPLQARAGLHVGPVILRENDGADIARGAKPLEVDGLAKPIAARVMSLARGGQILLTSEAREALGQTALRVHSHGHWVLKGVAHPLELFEAGEAHTVFVPPSDTDKVYRVVPTGNRWLPVREIPNNLPQQATSFIGRERELDEVRALLERTRLLTLLGMGGLGKTRLALQVASEVMAEYPDGVWFLDLSGLRDAGLVAGELAQVLGLHEEPGRPLLQTLCAHFRPQRALLIIDNCEHLIKASADLVNAVLRAAPRVRIMTSSRETLRLTGEQAYPVLPLPLPGRQDGLQALKRSTAVRLFVERAQQHKPSFLLTEREAPAVQELVVRLEGIPLALELAAARVRSLTVADINTRLKDRYKLLVGGDRLVQARQQTLRALVDWSYELLSDSEQTALNRLSVFVGGFDLVAAEKVCGAEPLDRDAVLDLLGSLVEKSLVMPEEREDGTRYRMLETIADYARDKLQHSAEPAATAARHCEHYLALAKEAGRGLIGPQHARWISRVETEMDNLRAAMALALSGGVDPVMAVKLAVALQGFWILRGYASEGRSAVRAALLQPAVLAADVAHGFALYVGAALAGTQSDHAEAQQMLQTCLALRRRLGNQVEIAATLSTLSLARLQGGDAAGARAEEEEALQIFRRCGDRVGEAIGLLHLGQIALELGDGALAHAQLQQSLAIACEIQHQEVEGECELALGEVALDLGDEAQGRLRFLRSLAVCRAAGDKRGEANAVWHLGQHDLMTGEVASAQLRLCEAVQAFDALRMREQLLACLEDHARLAWAEGHADAALRLAAAVSAARDRQGLARSLRLEQRWRTLLDAWCRATYSEAFNAAWEAGLEMRVEEAVRDALSRVAVPAAACAG